MNGFVVNWIDSKASFCDDYSMETARDQFLSYVNRYELHCYCLTNG